MSDLNTLATTFARLRAAANKLDEMIHDAELALVAEANAQGEAVTLSTAYGEVQVFPKTTPNYKATELAQTLKALGLYDAATKTIPAKVEVDATKVKALAATNDMVRVALVSVSKTVVQTAFSGNDNLPAVAVAG